MYLVSLNLVCLLSKLAGSTEAAFDGHKSLIKSMSRQFLVGAVAWWRSSVCYVSSCCQLKYVVKNMILKYVQSNENIMCIIVSNFFPFHNLVE